VTWANGPSLTRAAMMTTPVRGVTGVVLGSAPGGSSRSHSAATGGCNRRGPASMTATRHHARSPHGSTRNGARAQTMPLQHARHNLMRRVAEGLGHAWQRWREFDEICRSFGGNRVVVRHAAPQLSCEPTRLAARGSQCRVLRPRQDGHRQVERARLRASLLSGRPDYEA
jgi:hypothetical protein